MGGERSDRRGARKVTGWSGCRRSTIYVTARGFKREGLFLVERGFWEGEI